jgi:hypothetical protein
MVGWRGRGSSGAVARQTVNGQADAIDGLGPALDRAVEELVASARQGAPTLLPCAEGNGAPPATVTPQLEAAVRRIVADEVASQLSALVDARVEAAFEQMAATGPDVPARKESWVPEAGTMRGVVADATGPLPGHRVSVFAAGRRNRVRWTTTGPEGRYEVTDLEPGSYEVSLAGGGTHLGGWFAGEGRAAARARAIPLQVTASAGCVADVTLERAVRVAGTVRDRASQPLPGVQLRLAGVTGGATRTVRADATGRFAVTRLRPGSYCLGVARANGAESTQWAAVGDDVVTFTVAEGEALTVDHVVDRVDLHDIVPGPLRAAD